MYLEEREGRERRRFSGPGRGRTHLVKRKMTEAKTAEIPGAIKNPAKIVPRPCREGEPASGRRGRDRRRGRRRYDATHLSSVPPPLDRIGSTDRNSDSGERRDDGIRGRDGPGLERRSERKSVKNASFRFCTFGSSLSASAHLDRAVHEPRRGDGQSAYEVRRKTRRSDRVRKRKERTSRTDR